MSTISAMLHIRQVQLECQEMVDIWVYNLVHICDTKVLISPLSSIDIHNVIKSANLIIIFRGGGLVGRGLRK